jgi:hypothetical protein
MEEVVERLECGCRTPPEAEGWIPEEIGHHPQRDDRPCKSGMVQGKRREEPDQRQHGTRNLERTDAQGETTDATAM